MCWTNNSFYINNSINNILYSRKMEHITIKIAETFTHEELLSAIRLSSNFELKSACETVLKRREEFQR